MEKQRKENPLESLLQASNELLDFLREHPQIVFATTTSYKVQRLTTLFGFFGITDREIICLSAPSEPSSWARPEEIAQAKVIQVSELDRCPRKSLIIGTDVTVSINDSIAPLGKLGGTEDDIRDQLIRTVGPNSLKVGIAEVVAGVAIYSGVLGRGLYERIYYPFTFSPLTEKEIEAYVKRDIGRIKRRAGGCDFAGGWQERILAIAGVERESPYFPQFLSAFKNTALGVPFSELTLLLEEFPGLNGVSTWTRIYPGAPPFLENR